ncbi:hemagglutinin repeat-containing protein [Roseobacter sp. EG26]|uniref:two-partner secretion domain-containing protein n=1 Tax=Roseobacter sp. EG26 TaxID=3412477 RepID=UPI003CE52CE2
MSHALVVTISSTAILLSAVTQSYAQAIIVDPSAPGTSFLVTGNGTPQVDIAAPQSGVSVNKFKNFDVGGQGVVLNNSTTDGMSVIGQNVTANPNLMVSGPANTIVNEITGAASSSLLGTIEVFGQEAAVIIANPNGISCNGCAFINSSASILATGVPTVDGSNVGLLVNKGTITIGPDGFEAGQQGGVFGRHVIVNGPVTTIGQTAQNDLLISGGAQSVSSIEIAALNDTDIVSAPGLASKTSPFAVDAAERGTLTSGNVRIVNREAGQGVNLYGDVNARSLSAVSAGNLFYKDVEVEAGVSIFGESIRQYGDLAASGNVSVNGTSFTLYSGRKITSGYDKVTGDAVAGDNGHISINAGDFVVIAGEVSGIDVTVDVSNGSLTNTGFLMADGELVVSALEGFSQQRKIAREYDIYFDPALQQYLQAYYAQLIAGGAEADIAADMIQRASQYDIVKEYVDRGATATATNVSISSDAGSVTNTGGAVGATNDVVLSAGVDIINNFLTLRSRLGADDGCPAGNCGYRTDFFAGEILAGNDLTLSAGQNVENQASDIAAANLITLNAGQDVLNFLRQSTYSATGTIPITVAVPYSAETCEREGRDYLCQRYTGYQSQERTGTQTLEKSIFRRGNIVSLYGDVTIDAERDFVSFGSVLSSGQDLDINAGGRVLLSNFIDVVEASSTGEIAQTYQKCTGSSENGDCVTSTRFVTVDGGRSWELTTASTDVLGKNVTILAKEDIVLPGTRLVATGDLSLISTEGSLLVSANDVPNEVSDSYPGGVELVELPEEDIGKIFASPETAAESAGQENAAVYAALLKDDNLLTAVEALRRADTGADIKDIAKSVGVQSYASLFDNSKLETLNAEAQVAVNTVTDTINGQIEVHDQIITQSHEEFRSDIADFTSRLDLSDAERTASIQTQLDTLEAERQVNTSQVESTYQAALAANQAQYGPYLYDRHQVIERWAGGRDRYPIYKWVYTPNAHYFSLKNAADAQANSLRVEDLAAINSLHDANVALTQASVSDEGIAQSISARSTRFYSDIEALGQEKQVLLGTLYAQLQSANQAAERVVSHRAAADAIRAGAIVKGTVVEGEKSLATALTNDAFPELALTQDVFSDADGFLKNARDGDQIRTRLVTASREIGEYQDRLQNVAKQRNVPKCHRNRGGDEICYPRWETYYVQELRPTWVITGTEEYLAPETYFDGVPSTNVLISDTKSQQDAFIGATAWRLGAASNLNDLAETPRALVTSQGDLSLSTAGNAHLAHGDFKSKGELSVLSLGNIALERATLDARDVDVIGSGDLAIYGSFAKAQNNFGAAVGGNAEVMSLGTEYDSNTNPALIIGTLATDARPILPGETFISHEMTSIDAGGDLSVIAGGDVTLSGLQARTGGDALLTSDQDLTLSSTQSVIEYHTGNAENGTDRVEITSHLADFDIGGSFRALAQGNLTLEGTQVTAAGSVRLAALNNLILAAAQDVYDYDHRTYNSSLLSNKTTRNTRTVVTNKGSSLSAGGALELESQTGNVTTAGSSLVSSGGDISISATQGDVLAGTYTDINEQSSFSRSSSFFGLFGSTRNSSTAQRFATGTTALSALDLSLVSGADTELVGAQLSAGNDLNLNVGGDLRVLAAINSERSDFFESKLGAVVASTVTENSFRETAVRTTFNAQGDVNITVGGDSFLTLYGDPNVTGPKASEVYPDELLALTSLVLLDRELADEYFYDESKSLSPAFMALATIVAGVGIEKIILNAAAAPGASTAVKALATSNTSLSVAGNAVKAFAASSLIGATNGAVSGELELDDILKNAAFSAAQSFLAQSINLRAAGDVEGSLEAVNNSNSLMSYVRTNLRYGEVGGSLPGLRNLNLANLSEQALDGALNAGLSSAVYGNDFGRGFSNSLIRSVVALGLADTQNRIGGVFAAGQNGGEGSVGHVLLHGIAGCAAAELQGASCGAGAAGGVSQAILAGLYNQGSVLTEQQQANNSELTGALVGYIFSGGRAENVSTASAIALSGFRNNYLFHVEAARRAELRNLKYECDASDACSAEESDEIVSELNALNELDQQRDAALDTACGGGYTSGAACRVEIAKLKLAFDSYQTAYENGTLSYDGTQSEYIDPDNGVANTYGTYLSTQMSQAAATALLELPIDNATGLIDLAAITLSAAAGDPQAQAQLLLVKDAFLHPLTAIDKSIKADLAEADRLEALGTADSIKRANAIRSKVFIEGAFAVTGITGVLSAASGGIRIVGKAPNTGPLPPRVDISDDLNRINRSDVDAQYLYRDPDSGHGIEITVQNGSLEFNVAAGGDAAALGSGTDMFNSAILRLQRDGVVVDRVQGVWIPGTGSDNYSQFINNVNSGLTRTDAARNTWTGRIAASHGYTEVVETTRPGSNVIDFEFVRP